MPTLFRFLYWCALIAGVIYAILFSLAYLVEPKPRDATIEIPSERTNPPVQQTQWSGSCATCRRPMRKLFSK